MIRKPHAPVTMPADAVGFVAQDPQGRLALFHRGGTINKDQPFALNDTLDTVCQKLARRGMRLLDDGSVIYA